MEYRLSVLSSCRNVSHSSFPAFGVGRLGENTEALVQVGVLGWGFTSITELVLSCAVLHVSLSELNNFPVVRSSGTVPSDRVVSVEVREAVVVPSSKRDENLDASSLEESNGVLDLFEAEICVCGVDTIADILESVVTLLVDHER